MKKKGPYRLLSGGLVERIRPLSFTFNGRKMQGYGGDTLASALMAGGVRVVGRSFKYHRPRGVFSAGSEEPNALMSLGRGAAWEPNTKATMAELFDGLEAHSQNHLGSLNFDLLAANDFLSPFLSAGFYYKTFMWPRSFWEKIYEPMIRRAAGLGALSMAPDPDCYDHGYLHCDVLIIGGGPAGIAAALSCGGSGARVILVDEDNLLGGRLNAETYEIEGSPAHIWAAQSRERLAQMDNLRIMTRSTVFGAFDHGVYGVLERKTDHLGDAGGKPRQVLWRVYSKAALLCAGAGERSIAFGNNDRPGVMLAGAARSYLNRFAVAPGHKVAIFTNNDDGWRTARDLRANNIEVAALVDSRPDVTHVFDDAPVFRGAFVCDTAGRRGIKRIKLSTGARISADCLAVSGGFSPNLHLSCHHRGRPVWREDIAAFVPGGDLPKGMRVCGAAGGTLTLAACLADGHVQAIKTLEELGFSPDKGAASLPRVNDEDCAVTACWHVKESSARAWVDPQNDVTTKDIEIAHREGFEAPEHLKRYTTMGMATDQGRNSSVIGLGVMADCQGKTIAETGSTIFRPPYVPVAIGAFAGRARGQDFRPSRLTPSHEWAKENGAVFVTTGMWMRAQWFAQEGETHWRQSVDREVQMTRESVGICDVTTLGKIDIQGRDAAAFLNKVYANGFATLKPGRVRYGLMLREDGLVYDDGTTACLAENHYVMTTTTANAVGVFRHLEFARQCLWPEMDVHLISVTDGWAQYAVAGPNSRQLLEKIVDGVDISNEAFPFMACTSLKVCGGIPARLFRISFSGELAYEVAVPTRYGDSLIRNLMAAGKDLNVTPYGTEALGVMRIEKGHPAGNELNGQTTAAQLGLGRMISRKKDYIGAAMARRPHLMRDNNPCLVGLRPVDKADKIGAGAHFLDIGVENSTKQDLGWVSSVAYSPSLGHYIGLGFLQNGQVRMGEKIRAYNPVQGQDTLVEIVSPHFIDPEGKRQNA